MVWRGIALAAPITADDVGTWPYSVGILVKWVAFLSSLHWPAALGVGGVSFVEMLILYELWAGERLVLEKAVPRYRRPERPISVSTVPFGPGTDIWRSCRFVGALFRALCALPGGGRFMPCDIGAYHCRSVLVITAGFGTLDGSSVVMVSLPGRENHPRRDS